MCTYTEIYTYAPRLEFRRGAISLHIKCRIHAVNILLIQLFAQKLDGFSKTLEVYNLPFPKEPDHIIHIRVIAEPEDVIIGHPGLLLWCDHP